MLKKCFELHPNDIEDDQKKNEKNIVNIQIDSFEEKLNGQKNENNSESEENHNHNLNDEIINSSNYFHPQKEIKKKQLIVEQNNEFKFLLFLK